MKEQLTDWFPSDSKPERIGVYEVSPYVMESLPKLFQNWNGRYWGKVHYTPQDADRDSRVRSDYQRMVWRGLLQDPSA